MHNNLQNFLLQFLANLLAGWLTLHLPTFTPPIIWESQAACHPNPPSTRPTR